MRVKGIELDQVWSTTINPLELINEDLTQINDQYETTPDYEIVVPYEYTIGPFSDIQ
jgi:hypothetical protein